MSDDWRTHPSVSGPASLLLSVHDQFRAVSARLQVADLSFAARMFVPLAQVLHHHHHAEEASLFPMVHRRSGDAPAELVTDHEELTNAIAAVQAELSRATLARFHDALIAHLDREEALVIPILLAMTPNEGWAELQGS